MLFQILLIFSLLLMIPNINAFASDAIMITISEEMEDVIFDGKWTHLAEWKQSSRDTLQYDQMTIQLRTAHQNNFVYILLDVLNDVTQNKNFDQAIICFDTNNDKSTEFDDNDFCFLSLLDNDSKTILQGNSLTNSLDEINIHPNYIGVATMSDENDRYSKIPHATYEFKIPTELIGRHSTYGFYLSVHDDSSGKNYNWPQSITLENSQEIPNPSMWGELISPDKSLPEFHFMFVVVILSIFSVIIFTKIKKISYY